MKLKASTSRKLRYGGVTAVLTALIIAVVIIFNVGFSALAQKFLWYADLTPELIFTLSDNCLDLMENGDPTFENSSSPIKALNEHRAARKAADPNFKDEELMIEIVFCDDPDAWESNAAQRYVYETAKQLESEYPEYIKVSTVNIIWNPSAVKQYEGVSQTSVIIRYDLPDEDPRPEYRVRALTDFYVFNTDDTTEEPWAYNGEKIMVAAILAVTRADAPIACITTNHGESFEDTELLMTLDTAGFRVQALNLAEEEIPESCRLIVVYNPKSDFAVAGMPLANGQFTTVDETKKLETFLDGTNSLMVFMAPGDPLPEFEEYLAEWGIQYNRLEKDGATYPYMVQDTSQSLTVDGFSIKADYYLQGLGGKLTEQLRKRTSVSPAMIFQNAMPISFSEEYDPVHYVDEEDSSIQYDYATRSVDGHYRSIYNVFTTSENAIAVANGEEVAKATAAEPFKLMTVSVEDRSTQESNYTSVNEASYVIACGSPEFASQALLQSNAYGNNAFLEYALRTIGQEPVPVGLTFKPFGDTTIDTVTTSEATQYTVVLTVVPALAALVTGVVIIVRRKHR